MRHVGAQVQCESGPFGECAGIGRIHGFTFAQGRFCTTEGIENVKPVSLFRSKDFAGNYGLMMVDGPLAGLTARAVIIVDENGKVIYAQLVPEITEEPDYDAALSALK